MNKVYSKNISELLFSLSDLACEYGICKSRDKIYALNRAVDVCGLTELECPSVKDSEEDNCNKDIFVVVQKILDLLVKSKIIEVDNDVYRDLFMAKLMDCFIISPSEVENEFREKYNKNPVEATNFLYNFSKSTQYIRMDRISKNINWKSCTKYGQIDITINLSKPEKDPKTIAKLANTKSISYPKCLLCKENEGYAGGINYPARQNHRVIELDLLGEKWYMQYSPYVYYNEHCIVFKATHEPMQITQLTFQRLLEFVTLFPHYFIGSNADLPIVGGSILSHDHFQGGRYSFAMDNAKVLETFIMKDYPSVRLQTLLWPLSVIRLKSTNRDELANAANNIFEKWQDYEDLERMIIPFSNGSYKVSHNTVTPIARRVGIYYELDIVLRNNRTNDEHSLGIFHPHSDVHNIKKENIGLIEVLGLAVLPARLEIELEILAKYWVNTQLDENINYPEEIVHHKNWYNSFFDTAHPKSVDEAKIIIKNEVSKCFIKVLEYAGVFKQTKSGNRGMEIFLNKFR